MSMCPKRLLVLILVVRLTLMKWCVGTGLNVRLLLALTMPLVLTNRMKRLMYIFCVVWIVIMARLSFMVKMLLALILTVMVLKLLVLVLVFCLWNCKIVGRRVFGRVLVILCNRLNVFRMC